MQERKAIALAAYRQQQQQMQRLADNGGAGASPLAENGRANAHAAHEWHSRASQRTRRRRDRKERRPAVRLGGGMVGGVPPLPGTPSPAMGSPAGLVALALTQGMSPTTSGSSSSSGRTPSAPVNGDTAPSGSGAASSTDLPPLPTNVQLNPRARAYPGAVRGRDPRGPGVDGGGPRVRGALPRDGRAREGGARGGARGMRARWWECDAQVEAAVAARRRKEMLDRVYPHVPGSREGGRKKVRRREGLKVTGKLKPGEANRA
ncbi:hypothetical protein DFH11DRAFT_1760253 [Phellopilus nigrolimitatus]|nr:hypothetical protein DFH11DRAFT_1760253 [Phellopilus nigrolimitatus]